METLKQNYFTEATKNILMLVTYEPTGKHAVLRKRVGNFQTTILRQEADYMGFDFRVRTIPETAEFTKLLKNSGVLVPLVYEYGDDYMIEEYIEGTPLDRVFKETNNFKVAERFLNQVTDAHQKGLSLAERWGKNEILTPSGQIVFVDLDIQYLCGFAKELELAEAVNAVAVWSQKFPISRKTRSWLHQPMITQNYDLDKIIWLLQKHVEFWQDPEGYLQAVISPGRNK